MTKISLCLAAREKNKGYDNCINSFAVNSKIGFDVFVNCVPSRGAAWPVNEAVMMAYHDGAELMVVAADDVVCTTPGWDTILLAHPMAQLNDARVFMADEGRKSGELLCHPVFTRAWIDILGYAVPPGYAHYYSDTDVERTGRLAHCLHYVPAYKIDHRIGSADADWRPAKLALMTGDRVHYLSQKERQEHDAAKLRDFNAHSQT